MRFLIFSLLISYTISINASDFPGFSWDRDIKANSTSQDVTSGVQPTLDFMDVDRVHNELNVFGTGVKVGIISTGVNHLHEALLSAYAGRKADGSYDHRYAWLEAFTGGRTTPVDPFNIGTHVTGTILGTKNGIGVAPGATFMMCKSIDDAQRDTIESTKKCLRFMLNPHDFDGLNPRPELRPDIVIVPACNSCISTTNSLLEEIQNLRRAGVVVITPSGVVRDGFDKCTKVLRQPSMYNEVFTVGAITISSGTPTRLPTSAAGPAVVNDKIVFDRIKPDAVSPGESHISSVYLNDQSLYFPATGTPVAAAQVTGVVALMLSANPHLKGRVETIENILRQSSDPTGLKSLECKSPQDSPNFLYGHGAINAFNAVQEALKFIVPQPVPALPPQPVPAFSNMAWVVVVLLLTLFGCIAIKKEFFQ